MAKRARAGRVVLSSGGKGNTEGGRQGSRPDFADTVGGMPDLEELLAHAQRARHCQRSFLEQILLAVAVSDPVVQRFVASPSIRKRRVDGLHQPVGTQGLLGLDCRRFLSGADAITDKVGLGIGSPSQYRRAGFAGDEAVRVLACEETVFFFVAGQGRSNEIAIHASDDAVRNVLVVDKAAGEVESEGAGDAAFWDDGIARVEAGAESGVDFLEKLVVEALDASRAFFFGDAEEQSYFLRFHIWNMGEALLDGGDDHVDELGQAAPGLFERDLGADNPFATFIHEACFGEVIDAATDGGTGGRGV